MRSGGHLVSAVGRRYFHINAISLDVDGNLLLSARHTSTVYKVDRRTGRVIWRLGGKKSDFDLGPGVRFWYQHNPIVAGPDTIRLFDSDKAMVPRSCMPSGTEQPRSPVGTS